MNYIKLPFLSSRTASCSVASTHSLTFWSLFSSALFACKTTSNFNYYFPPTYHCQIFFFLSLRFVPCIEFFTYRSLCTKKEALICLLTFSSSITNMELVITRQSQLAVLPDSEVGENSQIQDSWKLKWTKLYKILLTGGTGLQNSETIFITWQCRMKYCVWYTKRLLWEILKF